MTRSEWARARSRVLLGALPQVTHSLDDRETPNRRRTLFERLSRDAAAVVDRDLAERKLHFGEERGRNADGIDPETHQDSCSVPIARHLPAYANLAATDVSHSNDALDHAQGARVERLGVFAVLSSHHREEVVCTDADKVGCGDSFFDLVHGRRRLDHRAHCERSATEHADSLHVVGAPGERQEDAHSGVLGHPHDRPELSVEKPGVHEKELDAARKRRGRRRLEPCKRLVASRIEETHHDGRAPDECGDCAQRSELLYFARRSRMAGEYELRTQESDPLG
jgi:hypothetical protein